MERKERHPSRRARTAQKGCSGCLLCRGVSLQEAPKPKRAASSVVHLRPGAAARLFVA